MLALAAALAGAVAGQVQLTGGDDSSGVVVYLEVAGAAPRPSSKKVIVQRERRFSPEVMVVQTGEAIEFANEDKVFHNVFSVSEPARFDLGLYKSGSVKAVTFRRPGVVDVYCNIHPEMVARVRVLDSPYNAITDSEGRFTISGVPPGSYELVAWQRSGDERRAKVDVAAGATSTVSLQMEKGKVNRRHLRKDGTPYGRYQ